MLLEELKTKDQFLPLVMVFDADIDSFGFIGWAVGVLVACVKVEVMGPVVVVKVDTGIDADDFAVVVVGVADVDVVIAIGVEVGRAVVIGVVGVVVAGCVPLVEVVCVVTVDDAVGAVNVGVAVDVVSVVVVVGVVDAVFLDDVDTVAVVLVNLFVTVVDNLLPHTTDCLL